jgi:hypothetical protein
LAHAALAAAVGIAVCLALGHLFGEPYAGHLSVSALVGSAIVALVVFGPIAWWQQRRRRTNASTWDSWAPPGALAVALATDVLFFVFWLTGWSGYFDGDIPWWLMAILVIVAVLMLPVRGRVEAVWKRPEPAPGAQDPADVA